MDSPTNPAGNPSSVPTVPGLNQSHADSIISSLLSFPDSSPISISSTFDRVLDDALASASGDVSVQDSLVDRTLELASLLLYSTKRCFRKRASLHNSNSWFLPPELTIKVFSMLDTKSLVQAAACCTMFNNCAMDRLSYAHIDLTTATKQTDNGVVNTMIHRAGKELRSIKLGSVTRSTGSNSSPSLVPGPLLAPLSYNHGFLGSRLRSLQLYNLRQVNYDSLSEVLSVCPNIIDLRIVGLCTPYMQLFTTLAKKCRLIEHMCLETYGLPGAIDAKTGSPLLEFVTNSLKLTSLTLIGFRLTEEMARKLVESCRKLKYLNLSRSPTIKGRFLRDLTHSRKGNPLETIILRNCPSLHEKEVLELCNSILKGNFKSIRHIDVSNNRGLDVDFGDRSYKPKFPLEKLKEERPDVTFVADFPLKRSEKRYRVCAGLDEEELRLIEMMEAENEDESDDDDDTYDGTDEVDSDEELLL
uniref:F-box protein SKIP17 n=1 Tax=Noccaea caerulescens TaxID=107243 RepID=A0A1J3K7V7_NOCCA